MMVPNRLLLFGWLAMIRFTYHIHAYGHDERKGQECCR